MLFYFQALVRINLCSWERLGVANNSKILRYKVIFFFFLFKRIKSANRDRLCFLTEVSSGLWCGGNLIPLPALKITLLLFLLPAAIPEGLCSSGTARLI